MKRRVIFEQRVGAYAVLEVTTRPGYIVVDARRREVVQLPRLLDALRWAREMARPPP